MITAHVIWALNATGLRGIAVTYNGTTVPDDCITLLSSVASSTANNAPPVSCIKSCAVNDILRLYVYQSSGGNLNVDADVVNPFFSATYLGKAA
jgi:hypothetical protein